MNRLSKRKNPAIALFVLLSALMVITFAMKELLSNTSLQISKVRNNYDRIQAILLARSTFNLARFFIIFDYFAERQAGQIAADAPGDPWSNPIPFPIPIELMTSFQAEASGQDGLSSEQQDKLKRCSEFFDDFYGEALAEIGDLSARINLNDLEREEIQQVVLSLLTPNLDFINNLESRNIRAQEVVEQIRDFIDKDVQNNTTETGEDFPYADFGLDYGPKNAPLFVIDELKMVPSIDDELFEYFSGLTSAYYYSGRQSPSKINLNTVNADVFQALLRGVNDPQVIAEEFIAFRDQNGIIFTANNIEEELEKFGIVKENTYMSLLTGVSEAFQVNIQSRVGDMELEMESIVKKPTGKRDVSPIVRTRLLP